MSDQKKSIILNLPIEVYNAVCDEAKANGLSVSGYLRSLISYGYLNELRYDQVTQRLVHVPKD